MAMLCEPQWVAVHITDRTSILSRQYINQSKQRCLHRTSWKPGRLRSRWTLITNLIQVIEIHSRKFSPFWELPNREMRHIWSDRPLESNSEALLITNHERMIREARLLLLQTN